uniref:Sulfotransferase n=1 Tax=Ditylenchus dipsaci TaxID=166011 RepID=A0A915EH63_9BILA
MFRYYHHFRAIVLSLVVGCVVFMLLGGLCQHDHWALPIVNRRSRVQLAFSNHCTAESGVQEGDCVVPPLISFEKRFRVVPVFGSIFVLSKRLGLSNWLHLAVVRDPIHRFLSAFVDKCVLERTWRRFPARCNRCQTNMTCFVDRQFERMVQFAAGARLNSF